MQVEELAQIQIGQSRREGNTEELRVPLLATRDMLHTDRAQRRHRKIQGTEEMCISTTWAVYMVKQSQEHISANLVETHMSLFI